MANALDAIHKHHQILERQKREKTDKIWNATMQKERDAAARVTAAFEAAIEQLTHSMSNNPLLTPPQQLALNALISQVKRRVNSKRVEELTNIIMWANALINNEPPSNMMVEILNKELANKSILDKDINILICGIVLFACTFIPITYACYFVFMLPIDFSIGLGLFGFVEAILLPAMYSSDDSKGRSVAYEIEDLATLFPSFIEEPEKDERSTQGFVY